MSVEIRQGPPIAGCLQKPNPLEYGCFYRKPDSHAPGEMKYSKTNIYLGVYDHNSDGTLTYGQHCFEGNLVEKWRYI